MRKIIFATALIFALSAVAFAEYSTQELVDMTLNSLHYDKGGNVAYAKGYGIISGDKPVDVALARRAALTDAQRGLLILRRSIKEGKPPRSDSVSGYVPPVNILSENIDNGLYSVEISAVLSDLIKGSKKGKAVGTYIAR